MSRATIAPADLAALRSAVEQVAAKMKPRVRWAPLLWRGRHLVVRRSYMRLFVQDLDGSQVALFDRHPEDIVQEAVQDLVLPTLA